ncbi:MAG: response regulator [Lachnospiraceae bacterium]|nr:response regulator [Lachnospiraceae bacterium]MDY5521289.1 response regulator [Agathobacter sp.]
MRTIDIKYPLLFTTATEALEQFEKEKPDLIILDIMMPKLDGIAALMKIREVSHIPVIILSAKTQDQDKVYGLTMWRQIS